jgi:hypothetical protein
MKQSLKITFIVHAVVSALFGIWLFLAPGSWATLVNWQPFDPAVTRVFGAALLALALSSLLGFLAKEYAAVRIIVQMEIVLTVLATLGGLYDALVSGAPAFIWVCVVLFAAFAAAWIACYIYAERKISVAEKEKLTVER